MIYDMTVMMMVMRRMMMMTIVTSHDGDDDDHDVCWSMIDDDGRRMSLGAMSAGG